MYTLDTNIAIAYLDGDEKVSTFLEKTIAEGMALYLPAAVETELFSYPSLSESEAAGIENLLAVCALIQTNAHINRSAGALRRELHMKLGDALIAATALFTGTTLLTRNVRDFKNVPGLSVQAI